MRLKQRNKRRRLPHQQDKVELTKAVSIDKYKVLKTLWQMACQGELTSDEIQVLRDRYLR